MNYKNVLYLLRVERKSGRLIRGIKATHYREHGILAYWPYWVAAIIGIISGLIANAIADLASSDPQTVASLGSLNNATLGFLVAVPTLILLVSVVFTLFQQIQLSGLKATAQVMYWLPVTWQEHTLASILANLLGFPLAIVTGFAAGILVFAALNGLIAASLVTVLAMFAAAFMGSALTEIARVLIVRFTGAVYKSSGRAAVWVRLVGILAVIAVGYTIYFYIVYGNGSVAFIQGLSSVQNSLWFVPFVWLAVSLYYVFSGGALLALLFIAGSALFIVALYYVAVLMNRQFGLYEPPAIRVQIGGIYTPKTGLLGKIGFSTLEAAIIRKDIRSFTRRRELIGIFIVPIVFVIVPILNSMNLSGQPGASGVAIVFQAMIFLFPAAIMAMTLGNMLVGEEGQAVWRIYASPISAKNLVKAKFAFLVLLSTLTLVITGVIGVVFFQPTITWIILSFAESLFLIFALGCIGLYFGFRGADFTATRRARMIRQEWALISLVVCFFVGLAILAPLAPYAISVFASSFISIPWTFGPFEIAVSLAISGVIATVITVVFYRIVLDSAKELIRKAEI